MAEDLAEEVDEIREPPGAGEAEDRLLPRESPASRAGRVLLSIGADIAARR